MLRILFSIVFLTSSIGHAEDISLTIEEYDTLRNKISILVLDSSQVPLGTVLRVHGKAGTCQVRITERVSDHLIGDTEGCNPTIITPGMKLAYTPTQSWETVTPSPYTEPSEVRTSYNSPNLVDDILNRTTVFVGHNFANQLEGKVYSDGREKDLRGDTAFSVGLKGRIYDFTDRFSLSTEIGYETPRTLDRVTYSDGTSETSGGTFGYSPRLSLWSVALQGDAKLMERLNGFGGINISIPSVGNSPFSMSGALGFQGGANYQLYPQIALEGLVKITNMSLRNHFGETTDVSLAGLEFRGRYSF